MSNRDLLVNALNELKDQRATQVASRTAETNKTNSLQTQLNAEQQYYATLEAWQLSKRKASESKMAQLKNLIATSKNIVNWWTSEIAKTDVKIVDAQNKINQFDQALVNAMNTGMSEAEATQVAEVQTKPLVDELGTEERATAEVEESKKLVKQIITGVIILVVLGLIFYFVRRSMKKSKGKK